MTLFFSDRNQNTDTFTRLKKELKRIVESCNYFEAPFIAGPVDAQGIWKWQGIIKGGDEGPYRGGLFFVDIVIPINYASAPPVISFKTPIYNPAVSMFDEQQDATYKGTLALENLRLNKGYSAGHLIYDQMKTIKEKIIDLKYE